MSFKVVLDVFMLVQLFSGGESSWLTAELGYGQDVEAPLPDHYGALNDVTDVCDHIQSSLASFLYSGKKWGPSFLYIMLVVRSGSQSASQFILKMFGCGWARGSMQTGKSFFLRQKLLKSKN